MGIICLFMGENSVFIPFFWLFLSKKRKKMGVNCAWEFIPSLFHKVNFFSKMIIVQKQSFKLVVWFIT